MATILALLEALPKIMALVQLLFGMARDREQRGLGRKEAIADALAAAHRDIAAAEAAALEAQSRHARDPSDAAFDQDFKEG